MHFTYDQNLDRNSLTQGDVLAKTDEIQALLAEVHPHYCREEYTHFQILTQSCDLVRRGEDCSARYITLAAVRSFDTVLLREIEQQTDGKNLSIEDELACSDKHKARLSQFVESVLNNNRKEYFFLKAEPDYGLFQDSCTFLYLSIAIKREHYDKCLRAKCLQLDNVFQSKLGWLVGNLYSRVGTPDYYPEAVADKKAFNALVEETLERHILWIPQKAFTEMRANGADGLSLEEAYRLASDKAEEKAEKKLDQIIGVIRKTEGVEVANAAALKESMKNKKEIRRLLGYPDFPA